MNQQIPHVVFWALAIMTFEEWNSPGQNPNVPSGTTSWIDSNPGNIKYNSYSATLGDCFQSPRGFCHFASVPIGFNALCQFLNQAASGQLKNYSPDMTLLNFFELYSDNSIPYANFVADFLKVPTKEPIKNLI